MSTSKALQTIYEISANQVGKDKARQFVADSVFNLMFDLQEACLPITEKNIEEKLTELAEFCLKCSKKDVA